MNNISLFQKSIGNVIFGLMLEENNGNSPMKTELEHLVDTVRGLIGEEDANKRLCEAKAAIEIFVHACLDWAILEKLSLRTQGYMKNLPPEQGILVEIFYLKYTGRSVVKHEEGDHCPDFLLSIKKSTERYLAVTSLDLTPDQILEFLKPIAIEIFNSWWNELGFCKKNRLR